MRGTALVLTVAFVFASSTVLFGHAAGQQSDPMPPEECCRQSPPDATLVGTVLDGNGAPVAGATVSASGYGPIYYEETTSSNGSSSSGTGVARPCCYSGYNSTVTGQDGRYSLGVWAGDLQVSVYRDGYASTWAQVRVESGQTATQDFSLKAFPAKTAHITGKITDAKSGKGLGFASVSVRSPWYGLYECSWTDADRANSGSGGGAEPAPAPAEDASSDKASIMPYPYNPGCSITVHDDGTFEGDVTPGYAIVSVYAWQDCSTSRDADGSGSTSCGPEYLPWTRTMTLAANETTRIDVKLPSRAAPDATVSGYLVDVETGKAIPGATISFSNQETYAYGSATTDQDGSYSLRLRAGYHSVYAYSDGFLSWEGVLQVAKGASSYDVELTPGQEAGGGCCYAYAMDSKAAAPAAEGAPAPAGGGAGFAGDGDSAMDTRESGASAEQYQDLGGGLGPYNPEERENARADDTEPAGKGAPGAGLLLTGLAVGLALVGLRRRFG